MASKLYNVLSTYKDTILSHIKNYDNPHNLTYSQVGQNSGAAAEEYVTRYINQRGNSWGITEWNHGMVELVNKTYTTIAASGLSSWNSLYYITKSFTTTTNSPLEYVYYADARVVGGSGNYWVNVGNATYDSTGSVTISYSIISYKQPTAAQTLYIYFYVRGRQKSS